MTRQRSQICSFAFLLVGFGFTGCGSSTAPAMGQYVDVQGTVSVNGKPIKKAVIYFDPDGPGGRDQFADVQNGKFSTKLFVAKYKVAFDVETKRPNVPSKYTKFASSHLEFEVRSGMPPAMFELK